MSQTIKVHRIIEGIEEHLDGEDFSFWTIEVYVEFKGEFFETTLASYDFNKVYDIVKHMASPTLEPYIIGEEV